MENEGQEVQPITGNDARSAQNSLFVDPYGAGDAPSNLSRVEF